MVMRLAMCFLAGVINSCCCCISSCACVIVSNVPCASRLGKKLGEGYFATVHSAEWTSPHYGVFRVAVKKLKSSASTEERVRFLQEALIMAQFFHPNIVQLCGMIQDTTQVCVCVCACVRMSVRVCLLTFQPWYILPLTLFPPFLLRIPLYPHPPRSILTSLLQSLVSTVPPHLPLTPVGYYP